MLGNYPTRAAEVSLLSGKRLRDTVFGSFRRPGVRTRLIQGIAVMAAVRGQACPGRVLPLFLGFSPRARLPPIIREKDSGGSFLKPNKGYKP